MSVGQHAAYGRRRAAVNPAHTAVAFASVIFMMPEYLCVTNARAVREVYIPISWNLRNKGGKCLEVAPFNLRPETVGKRSGTVFLY